MTSERSKALLWWRLAAIAFAMSTGACAGLHSAQEIRGQVVDKETGRPLEGVIVVAQWQPYFTGPAHAPGHSGVIHVYEAVTDKEGRYHIPAWGPKPLPAGAEMRDYDPALDFFKPGFLPFSTSNTPFLASRDRRVPPGVSEWDGKVVAVSKYTGPIKEYAERVRVLSRNLRDAQENWKTYPRMVYALWQEEQRLPKGLFGPFSRLAPIDVERLSEEDRKYLEERGR